VQAYIQIMDELISIATNLRNLFEEYFARLKGAT
jgi:hypothetical protein